MKKKYEKMIIKNIDKDGSPDTETPEWTSTEFRRAKRGMKGLEQLIGKEAAQKLQKVGRPKSPSPKQNGTLRLASDIWDKIKASGRGYNSKVETILREAIEEGRI